MRGVEVGHPAPDLLDIEPERRPEPVAGDLAAPCALVDPPPGHTEKAAQLSDGQRTSGQKRIRVTVLEVAEWVHPSAVRVWVAHCVSPSIGKAYEAAIEATCRRP